MKKSFLLALWGGMFVLCAGLGFVPDPTGAARAFLTLLAVAFFVPPALMLRTGDRDMVKLVRNLAALSLGATGLLLALNFLTALGSETLGNALHAILTIVSSPMICSGYWALSLFLWACLLMGSFKVLSKR